MTRNVFRLTPRATQAIRTIEAEVQKQIDEAHKEDPSLKPGFILNAVDLRFAQINGKTIASFERLQVMYTLRDDPEFFLWDVELTGRVHMHERRGPKGFVYYETEKIELLPSTYEEADAA